MDIISKLAVQTNELHTAMMKKKACLRAKNNFCIIKEMLTGYASPGIKKIPPHCSNATTGLSVFIRETFNHRATDDRYRFVENIELKNPGFS